jgi:natural product biosynthesis luciferase-like monooxygenase protein
MYFPTGNLPATERYQLLLDSARLADKRGFHALWLPERHFHAFGGSYPNPAVAAAALAPITHRIRLRAGSVVLPLHDPLRVAEEWSLVDNLSGGRVDLAFATGWNANDFVLAPDDYAGRKQVTLDGIETIARLWSGGEVTRANGVGQPARVSIQPRPLQPRLDPWFTCSGGLESFLTAGGHGYHVLTGLLFQSLDELATKIALYRQARARHGHDPRAGKVTLMLHTFLGDDLATVREQTRVPLTQYLESSVDLWQQETQRLSSLGPAERAAVLDVARERYLAESALIGTLATAAAFVARLAAIGVDEIACLIDFGLDRATVLDGLTRLDELRRGLA